MKDYGKNAKKVFFAFGILSFLMVIVSLIYMNQYINLWFFETVNGITADDSSVASSNSNSAFFSFLTNNSDNLQNFITYFNPSVTTSGSLVGSWAAEISMSVYRGLNDVNTTILWLGLVSLVLFGLVLVFGNGSRRIYYKSNLIAGIVFPLISAVFAIVVFVQNTTQIGLLNENLDLLRAIDSIVESNGYSTASMAELISNSSVNATTIIVVDVYLVIFVCYSLFTAFYSLRRYTSCKEEREAILKKAVDANE